MTVFEKLNGWLKCWLGSNAPQIGTGANNIVALNGSGIMPAVDISLCTGGTASATLPIEANTAVLPIIHSSTKGHILTTDVNGNLEMSSGAGSIGFDVDGNPVASPPFPSSHQLPSCTYAAGGGTPGAGQFTSDFTSPSGSSLITLSKDVARGFAGVPKGSDMILVDATGNVINGNTINTITDNGADITFAFNVITGSGTWGGVYTISVTPALQTAAQVGLGNVTNDAQVKVSDIGTTVLAPDGDGSGLTDLTLEQVGISLVTGFASEASAGSASSIIADYSGVDFVTKDGGAFYAAFPETAAALTTLSAQLALLTSRSQAVNAVLRANSFPKN